MHMAAHNVYCKEVVSLLLKEGARVDTVDNVSVCIIVIMIHCTCVGYIMRLR